ncbi:DUF2752 domain-containing protein [Adhaeretor mobilis]|uniref:DUF2752 domain-containing protein n=1 Tax=Adhaeretor mobilis TaxID=1930276 RepID=UPI001C54F135|nr:DUF2752 domain-containing protein [Adhaeretor mobilis]
MKRRELLSKDARFATLALGVLLTVLLVVASRLTPDDRGFGTHEQLGLAGCWVQATVGWLCPACGMTTAWAQTLDGNLVAALGTNLGGTLLCLMACLIAPWLMISAVRGAWLFGRPTLRAIVVTATIVMSITMLDWARRAFLT